MAQVDNRQPLTIFHTNDFHNRLSATGAETIFRRMRETPEPKLLLDAGDAGGSSNLTFRNEGEPILEEMSRLGYDAMTVGNRDFHVSRMGFRAKLFRAKFPILCANVRSTNPAAASTIEDDERPLAGALTQGEAELRSYVCPTVGDWTVLIVGLTVPMVTPRMWERKLSAYVFDPAISTAARLIPLLRGRLKPNLIIALTHIGLRSDREVAAAVPEIDLIVGGHSHELLVEGERVGETLIVQAGSHGRHIGVVTADLSDDSSLRPRLTARVETL